jgi:sugar phosphate isomerase/epimerase
MLNKVHALDSFFYNSMGVYQFQSQCEMLAEIGFDGITVSVWGGKPLTNLSLLPTVKEKHGLEIAGLYLVLHEGRNDKILQHIIESVEGVELIELAVQTSVNGMSGILRTIESYLHIIERRGLRLSLYPHLNHITQTTSQVVTICEDFNHPLLGTSFNGYHWFASKEGNLEDTLKKINPWLMQVVLSGSAISPIGWGGVATMEPPDRGELDNFNIILALKRTGYIGSIGILGWDYGGDIYLKLERSLLKIKDILHKTEKHPNWTYL